MDTLSTLLENVHLYETKYYQLKICGQGAYSLTKKDVIVFYLVQSGELFIEVEGISRQLASGDMIMVPHSYHHICYKLDAANDSPIPIDPLLNSATESPIVINAGQPEAATVILIECKYDKELTRPLLAALPSILPDYELQSQSRFRIIEAGGQFLTLESGKHRVGKTAMVNHLASILLIECLRTHIERLPAATES